MRLNYMKTKTIEERAKEYAWSVWPNPMFAQEWEECKENYIAGAKEQKRIDIDKVCDWLRARNVLTDASLDGFRKAMEEEE